MTPEETKLIEHLKELEAKATPGPWLCRPAYEEPVVGNYSLVNAGGMEVVAGDDPYNRFKMAEEDGIFIAAARNAIPELLKIIDGQEKEIAELRRRE